MRKFIVHTRPLPGCCKVSSDLPTIVEVEGEVISSLEDPSVAFLPVGEFKFRIMLPPSILESVEVRQADGSKKKIMTPVVYYSHAMHHTLSEAQVAAKSMIKSGLDFEIRKGRLTSYTEEELEAKCSEIQILYLS